MKNATILSLVTVVTLLGLTGCSVEVRQRAYADMYRTYCYPGYTDTYYYNYSNYYYSYFPYYYSNCYTYAYW